MREDTIPHRPAAEVRGGTQPRRPKRLAGRGPGGRNARRARHRGRAPAPVQPRRAPGARPAGPCPGAGRFASRARSAILARRAPAPAACVAVALTALSGSGYPYMLSQKG